MASLGIEVRVGAFVLAALAALVGFVLVLGDFSLAPGFSLHADFAYSGGLQVGAPVKVSGIKVGRVTDLSILSADSQPPASVSGGGLGRTRAPVVRASLVLEEPARPLLTEDAKLYVGMQGVIGEAYVEVQPGSPEVALLAEGASVRGVDAPKLHVMVLHMSALLGAMGKLSDEAGGLGGLGEALTRLLTTVDEVVGEHKGEIESAIVDSAASARDLRALTASINRAVGDGSGLERLIGDSTDVVAVVKRDVPALLAQTRRALDDVEKLTTRVNGAVDPKDVEEIVADLRQTLAVLNATALDAQRVMDTIRRGQGTLGGLVTDPQVYDDLKEMLRDLKRNPWKMFWRD